MGGKMSHYSIYKTKVGNINAELLKQAIASLAREIGAEVVTAVFSWGDQKHDVLTGLKTANLPRGIGFGVDKDGTLTVHGDAYGQHEEFNRIQTLAQNYIKAYKVAQNARALNPRAKMQMTVRQKEVLLEVVI